VRQRRHAHDRSLGNEKCVFVANFENVCLDKNALSAYALTPARNQRLHLPVAGTLMPSPLEVEAGWKRSVGLPLLVELISKQLSAFAEVVDRLYSVERFKALCFRGVVA